MQAVATERAKRAIFYVSRDSIRIALGIFSALHIYVMDSFISVEIIVK